MTNYLTDRSELDQELQEFELKRMDKVTPEILHSQGFANLFFRPVINEPKENEDE